MSFQILDSNNQPIEINVLDQEACTLWNKEIDKKQYAYPEHKPANFASYKESIEFYRSITNWFDYIGYRIHCGMETWDEIREDILKPFAEFPLDQIMEYVPIGGYIKLIEHWRDKGYIPKYLKE